MQQQKTVLLHSYSSTSSNEIRDRKVEVFHLNPGEDLSQGYDVEKKDIRLYKLSRIQRVEITEEKWQYANKHYVIASDPFRIVDNNIVQVHLRITVGGKNDLLEHYPMTRAHIIDTDKENEFDFQCGVNHKFIGLTKFILGNYQHIIEIIAP